MTKQKRTRENAHDGRQQHVKEDVGVESVGWQCLRCGQVQEQTHCGSTEKTRRSKGSRREGKNDRTIEIINSNDKMPRKPNTVRARLHSTPRNIIICTFTRARFRQQIKFATFQNQGRQSNHGFGHVEGKHTNLLVERQRMQNELSQSW